MSGGRSACATRTSALFGKGHIVYGRERCPSAGAWSKRLRGLTGDERTHRARFERIVPFFLRHSSYVGDNRKVVMGNSGIKVCIVRGRRWMLHEGA
jgi:hypothetical protein